MRVFVYQAFCQAGGTFMAYSIGCILKQRFNAEVIAVGSHREAGMFRYHLDMPVIDEETMVRTASDNDLLICNPSFSDRMFGLRLPCRKLSYVQGVRTFKVLDVFFDRYVFVSDWVKRFIHQHYGIDGPVIPAFIDTDVFHLCDAPPVSQRRPVCAILARKHDPIVFERLRSIYARVHGVALPFEMIPVMPQTELAQKLREYRVYLSLDAMEGFGLPMLEAMGCGCAVVGWDSGGCGEYARSGCNALLARYGDDEILVRLIHAALTDDAAAEKLADAGVHSSVGFGQSRFDAAWEQELVHFFRR